MPRCLVDPTISRVRAGEFQFPLGVYPVEPFTPVPGYVSEFERADGGTGEGFAGGWNDDFEEWPDRYVFDVVLSVHRLPTLVDLLLSMMPGRVYPIFDVIGFDAYREIDPFMSYELVGVERVIDAIRELRTFLYEDGMAGFGAMSEDPFMYLFVDEHKILTLRIEPEQRERVQALLKAFDLEPVERLEGVDAANHEHRTVLLHPADEPEALSPEEIIEYLRENWRLRLNIDPEENVDEDGNPLGITNWRCVVRCASESAPTPRYAEVVLRADCLLSAEDHAMEGAGSMFSEQFNHAREGWLDTIVVSADRMTPEMTRELLGESGWVKTPRPPGTKAGSGGDLPRNGDAQGVAAVRWMD